MPDLFSVQQPLKRVGLLLAAGLGSRFGGRKLEARLADGRCLAQHSAANLAPHVDQLLCVLRSEDQALAELLAADGYELVFRDATPAALSASIRCGVQASAEAGWWCLALADMPAIAPAVYTELGMAMTAIGTGIVLPTYNGVRGHPVCFSQGFRPQLLNLQGDVGARCIVQQFPQAVRECPVQSTGIHLDFDTPEQLEAWLN